MKPRLSLSLVIALLAFTCGMTASAQSASETPSPEVIVRRAIDAAGGQDAFDRLGILLVERTSEEVAQAGQQSSSLSRTFFVAPGPTPGRIELPDAKVITGDDGKMGWAIVAGKPDPRPSTKLVIKRLIRHNLFSVLFPFSLSWEEVSVTGVSPTTIGNVPVWRLQVSVSKNFFHTPQTATNWTVDVDRRTYAVVEAQCPATDLGRGIKSDGMLITWGKPQNLRGVILPGEQRIVGLSETGAEKTHNRIDHLRYEVIDSGRRAALFENPVPPELRPTPPTMPMQPPGVD